MAAPDELDAQALLARVVSYARLRYDGHVSIFRFTSGWKAAYGTPDLDNEGAGREELSRLRSFNTLEECLSELLLNPVDFYSLDNVPESPSDPC